MNSYHVRIIIQRLSEHQSNLSIVIARINTTHSCNDGGNTQGEFISNSSIHQFTWGKNGGRDRVILDHDGSLTGEAGTIWSFRNRGRGTQQVTDMAAPIWASRGNNIPRWNDAVNSVLQFNFTGDP